MGKVSVGLETRTAVMAKRKHGLSKKGIENMAALQSTLSHRAGLHSTAWHRNTHNQHKLGSEQCTSATHKRHNIASLWQPPCSNRTHSEQQSHESLRINDLMQALMYNNILRLALSSGKNSHGTTTSAPVKQPLLEVNLQTVLLHPQRIQTLLELPHTELTNNVLRTDTGAAPL